MHPICSSLPRRARAALLLALLAAVTAPLAGAQNRSRLPYECGTLENHYGPFDYTNAQHYREKLPIVERAHFNRDVESLRRGQTAVRPGPDLHYVLGTFPNHHRALYSMLNYHRRYPTALMLPGTRYPAHCYFVRAVTFAPTDAVSHMLYGLFLAENGDEEATVREFETAVSLAPESAEVHYNFGLMLLDFGEPERALEHAHRANELGYPLPGLRNRLERAGAWRDAASAAAEDDPSRGDG